MLPIDSVTRWVDYSINISNNENLPNGIKIWQSRH